MKKYSLLLVAVFALSYSNAQIDRTKQPEPGPAPVIQLNDPTSFILKNGLTVLLVKNSKLPQVSISLTIDNPLRVEGKKAGTNTLLSTMMGKGSTSISKNNFEEEVDYMGAHFHFNTDGAHASVLSRYFSRILTLIADATIHPNFVLEEFEKEKTKLLTGLEASEKDVTTVANRVQNLVSYGVNHPYGEYLSKETVNNVTLEDVKKAYETNFNPKKGYITIVGDFDSNTIKKEIETAFGSWKAKKTEVTSFETPVNAEATKVVFVDMPNSVQSELAVLNTVSLDKKNPDYFPVIVANQILGGGGEARLFLNLREDKGFTYGAYSQIRPSNKTKGRFKASTSVRNAVTDSAVVELIHEINRIAFEPVTKEELELIKAKYAGSFVIGLEDPETIARYTYTIKTENLDPDFYRTFLQNLNKVSVEDVQRVAKKYFLLDKAQIVVTGNGRDVLDGIENISYKGKILPVEYRDQYGVLVEQPDYTSMMPEGLTAKSVIDGYINAIGGKENLSAIHSIKTQSEASFQGIKIEVVLQKTDKKQSLVETKMMGNVLQKQVVNSEYAYMEVQGQRLDFSGESLELMLQDADIFLELSLEEDQVELMGITQIEGKDAYEVKISNALTNFYDTESFLKVQSRQTVELMGNSQTSSINFNNYKMVNGVLVPHSFSMSLGPEAVEFNTTTFEFNTPIDPTVFK